MRRRPAHIWRAPISNRTHDVGHAGHLMPDGLDEARAATDAYLAQLATGKSPLRLAA